MQTEGNTVCYTLEKQTGEVKMESFIDYIENTLQGERDDATLYHFKRQLLDKMTERANEITHSGLHDEKVLSDLIISEYPDLPGAYQKYRVAAKRERCEKLVNKIMIFGTLALAFLLLVIYLTVSFLTDAWDKTWLIFAVGFLGWAIFLLSVGCTAFPVCADSSTRLPACCWRLR